MFVKGCMVTRSPREVVSIEKKQDDPCCPHCGKRASEKITPSIVAIAAAVAQEHGVSIAELRGLSRTKHITDARQEACYMAHKILGAQPTYIGRFFNRDRTTVIHAIKKLQQRERAQQ